MQATTKAREVITKFETQRAAADAQLQRLESDYEKTCRHAKAEAARARADASSSGLDTVKATSRRGSAPYRTLTEADLPDAQAQTKLAAGFRRAEFGFDVEMTIGSTAIAGRT